MTERNPSTHNDELLAAMSSAARQLDAVREGDEAATQSGIVAGAVETVPDAEHAGVSLLYRDGTITSAAISDDTVARVDRLQADHREGPCVTALWDQHTVTVDDLAAEQQQWPRFAPHAVEAGVASMLSFQLFAGENSLGALNLYAGTPAGSTPTRSCWAASSPRTRPPPWVKPGRWPGCIRRSTPGT